MNKNLLLLKGFPQSIVETNWQNMPLANPARFMRTIDLLEDDPMTLFLYKDEGISIDKLVSDGKKSITDFRAIDFAEYFSAIMDDRVFTVTVDVLYIYNVGAELANSTTFADKVLHKLVQHNKNAGNSTIITSSYYNSSSFTEKYTLTDQLVDVKLQVGK